MATTTRTRRSYGASAATLAFDKRLVLNQYMLGLFGAESLDALADGMQKRELEGLDENNVSRFYHFLTCVERPGLSKDLLLRYDNNIVGHTLMLQQNRRTPLTWTYFQYLGLLFAEIYLDRYFGDPAALRDALNVHVERFNGGKGAGDRVEPYRQDDLNKLAFWSATGSGKTLLMHVNIMQFRHYLRAYGRDGSINRTILLTPNDGLSRQHLTEFRASGLDAELFDKDSASLFAGRWIEIIDVNKLREESGDKTVAVDAFEGNNLVLVDEGHRGAGGDDWMDKRNRLCASGFSFEYSATFEQALKAANKPALTREYLRCILFDYSYRHFYGDGYGKDYRILNLPGESGEDAQRLYLTACLVTFYQQQRAFADNRAIFAPFHLEQPLWVFVGSSVTKSASMQDKTDAIQIIRFLARFVRECDETVRLLDRLLSTQPGLLDSERREIFGDSFGYLIKQGYDGRRLYDDVLRTLFNAGGPGTFYVENLLGVDGEIALRVGTGEPFGVINVGDDAALCKLCEAYPDEMAVRSRSFAASLFHTLNSPNSAISVLIGSRKFSEGWNSWRVSTMGLMNVGRNEGAQIIQLFGRGVRLKGYGYGLQRSAYSGLEPSAIPEHIGLLETLNVFGIKADYMNRFEEYLREEGLPDKGHPITVTLLPVIKHEHERELQALGLRTLKIKDGVDFKTQGPTSTLGLPPKYLQEHRVTLNWYPKLQALRSRGLADLDGTAIAYHEGTLTGEHIALLNLDAMYLRLRQFKHERGWHRFNLDRGILGQLLLNAPQWYTLQIPAEELQFSSFDRVRVWEDVALTLLKKYCEKYYTYCKDAWERQYLEYSLLDRTDPNFIKEYQLTIRPSQDYWVAKLNELKRQIASGLMHNWSFNNLTAHALPQHLYDPLLSMKKGTPIAVTPVALNEGEARFIEDLKAYLAARPEHVANSDVYLLRNKSQKGIGFFEASNFYPDFILWIVQGDLQRIAFIDPKGIRNLAGLHDDKIALHSIIKEIEARLADPRTTLFSFIVSNTSYRDVKWWNGETTMADFERRNVLFQPDDRDYIAKMLGQMTCQQHTVS